MLRTSAQEGTSLSQRYGRVKHAFAAEARRSDGG